MIIDKINENPTLTAPKCEFLCSKSINSLQILIIHETCHAVYSPCPNFKTTVLIMDREHRAMYLYDYRV